VCSYLQKPTERVGVNLRELSHTRRQHAQLGTRQLQTIHLRVVDVGCPRVLQVALIRAEHLFGPRLKGGRELGEQPTAVGARERDQRVRRFARRTRDRLRDNLRRLGVGELFRFVRLRREESADVLAAEDLLDDPGDVAARHDDRGDAEVERAQRRVHLGAHAAASLRRLLSNLKVGAVRVVSRDKLGAR